MHTIKANNDIVTNKQCIHTQIRLIMILLKTNIFWKIFIYYINYKWNFAFFYIEN